MSRPSLYIATRNVIRAIVFTSCAIALVSTAGCGADDATRADSEPPKYRKELQRASKPQRRPSVTPEAEAKPAVVAAVAVGDGDASRGQPLYVQYCASCHGERGAGDGPLAGTLQPAPSRHNDGGYMNKLSNDHLIKVIAEGGAAVGKSPLMAPWSGTLNPQQVADVARFVRTLAEPAYEGGY